VTAAREREVGGRAAIQRAEAQDAGRISTLATATARAQELVELAPIAFPFADETLYFHAVAYEDRITIPTPEGVSLELTLAGLGSRAIAGAIDLVFKGLLLVCVLVLLLAVLGLDGVFVIVPSIALGMLVYDVAFEVLASGRTPGKRISGLRVVRSSGSSIDLFASMIRNVLRLVDSIGFYLPAIVSILVTQRNQRIGDLAADTVVIRDRRAVDAIKHLPSVDPPAGDPFGTGARWDVSAVATEDVATVRAFLERRAGLLPDARARIAAQLDAALRPLVGGADERDPERFLEILYEAKRAGA
jgi:uncharacterized RDD family membrane protein YckC